MLPVFQGRVGQRGLVGVPGLPVSSRWPMSLCWRVVPSALGWGSQLSGSSISWDAAGSEGRDLLGNLHRISWG